jgi:AraC-like DNA-binding protein
MVPTRGLRGLGKIANINGTMSQIAPAVSTAPSARTIAQGPDWVISEFLCRSGPQDRPFEEQHEWYSISAVTHGHFSYRTASGRALLQPGAWLLGNHGKCFECGHDHGVGDRCLSLRLAPEFFHTIAASAANDVRFRFTQPALPPLPSLLPQMARLQTLAQAGNKQPLEEAVPQLAAAVLGMASGHTRTERTPSARDERRVSRALDYIASHAHDGSLGLEQLANVAAMSKYHFLRTFQQTVGVTPHQYLLQVRLRNAALGLATSPRAVSQVALDAGFGDLSTFNARFRKMFGAPPQAYRRGAA